MSNILAMTEMGMSNDVQRMQIISHNLANVGTVGFKKEIAVARPFIDHLQNAAKSATGGMRPAMTTYVDHTEGALKHTANPLDVGLEGSGYFVVQTPTGEGYTRQGSFRVDTEGRLVTASGGYPVAAVSGEIRLTTMQPLIDAQGIVWEGQTQVGQLKIIGVKNPDSMTTLGQGLYAMSDSTEYADTVPRTRQGFTETGNVVAMNEMIKMIETVRHFEASQRLVRAYDTMLDRAINAGGEV